MLLQFNKDMTNEYIEEVLRFHFKRSNKGTFSIEGRYNIYIEKRGNILVATETCCDSDNETKFKTYSGAALFIRDELIFCNFIMPFMDRWSEEEEEDN